MRNKVLNEIWENTSTKILLVLTGMFLLGLVIRFYGLGSRGLWYDEVDLWYGALTNNLSSHLAPLAPWLSFLFFALIHSATPFALHILPAVFGAAAIPVAFLVSTQTGNRSAGFLSAGLLMLNHMAIFYSQEARPYGFFIFLTALLYLSFLRAHSDHSPYKWLLYGFFTLLCCLTHLLTLQIIIAFFFFNIAAMVVPLFSDKDRSFRIKRFFYFSVTSLIGAGLGTLWVFHRSGVTSVLEGFYPRDLLSYLRTALVSLGPSIYYAYTPSHLADILGGIYVVLFIFGVWHFHKQKKYDLILFFLLAIGVPLLIHYMTLGSKGHWTWVRYISHLIVPYLVVIAFGTDYILGRLKHRTLRTILISMLFLSLLPGIWRWHQDTLKSRSSEMIEWSNQIASMSSKLKGIIIYVKWGNMRMPSKYFLYRKDMLPVYYLNHGKLATIIGIPSLGNITAIPQIKNHKKIELETGLYAMIYNTINPKGCQDLSKELNATYFVSCREDLSLRGGIIISHIAARKSK